jgi:hypothetical protein
MTSFINIRVRILIKDGAGDTSPGFTRGITLVADIYVFARIIENITVNN